MTQATFVREHFDILERVHKGDYVFKLPEGLQNPEETAGHYVTTPKRIDAFDRALGLVGDEPMSGQSKANGGCTAGVVCGLRAVRAPMGLGLGSSSNSGAVDLSISQSELAFSSSSDSFTT